VLGLVAIELVVAAKSIGASIDMLVKNFMSRVIVGHWYPIVSINFHEQAMTNMMVLRKGYTLVFGPSNVRKPCQGMDRLGKAMRRNLKGD